MFGKKTIAALEGELSRTKEKLENALKEKADLDLQLNQTRQKISEMEKKIEECELTELKDKAKQTIVEYEGLKKHYIQKTRELEDTRAEVEESFAKEAAVKRHDLAEEIRTSRENNQNMISETIRTFSGSYMYYLDQIRVLMDALSRAAKETGETLFDGEGANVKGRFGDRIAEHLQNDADTLEQNSGDLLLIGTEETSEAEAEENATGFGAEEEEPEGNFQDDEVEPEESFQADEEEPKENFQSEEEPDTGFQEESEDEETDKAALFIPDKNAADTSVDNEGPEE